MDIIIITFSQNSYINIYNKDGSKDININNNNNSNINSGI